MTFLKDLKKAILILIFFTIVLGVIYPLVIMGISDMIAPDNARGSLIRQNGQIIGSQHIGQLFKSDRYFHGRPSSAGTNGYDAASSSASNLAATNKVLIQSMQQRAAEIQKLNNSNYSVPIDLVTASGSGLDPDISPDAALYQAGRIAKVRQLNLDVVAQLIEQHIETSWIPFLGEPYVNVLKLNLALDKLTQSGHNN